MEGSTSMAGGKPSSMSSRTGQLGGIAVAHSTSSSSSSSKQLHSSTQVGPAQLPSVDVWGLLLARAQELQQQLSPLDAATIAWAVAKVNKGFDRHLVNDLATLTSQQAHLLQPQELCMAAVAHSRLLLSRYKRRWYSLRPVLAHRLLTRAQQLQEAGRLSTRQCLVLGHALTLISRMSPEALGAAVVQQRQRQQQQQQGEQTGGRQGGSSTPPPSAAAEASVMGQAGAPALQPLLEEGVLMQNPPETTLQNVGLCARLTAAAAAGAGTDSDQQGQQELRIKEQVMLAVTVVRLHEQRRLLEAPELAGIGSTTTTPSSSSSSGPVPAQGTTWPAAGHQQLQQDVGEALDAATAAVVRLMVRNQQLWTPPGMLGQQQQPQQQEEEEEEEQKNNRGQQQLQPREACMLLWSLVTLLVRHTPADDSCGFAPRASSTAASRSSASSRGRLGDADVAAAYDLLRLRVLPHVEALGLSLKLTAGQLVLVARACGLMASLPRPGQQSRPLGVQTAAATGVTATAATAAGSGLLADTASVRTAGAGPAAAATAAAAAAAAAAANHTLCRLVLVLRAEVPRMNLLELGHLVGAAAVAGLDDPDLLDEVAQVRQQGCGWCWSRVCKLI
jgi:hypothetical protein